MIRLRIGKEFKKYSKDGLLWYKDGRTYRMIIEQIVPCIDASGSLCPGTEWVPVEVIDEERKS